MAKQKEPIYQSTCFYDKNFQLIRQPLVQQGQKQFPAIRYALFMLVAAIGIYVINFSLWPFVSCVNDNGLSECAWYGFSSEREEWGQFGDFVGGLVNPFIGLLTIYLLVTTISQQSRALDQTEIALDHANKALEQNASALELTRTEIQMAQAEIKIGREIQKNTELALKEQIGIAKEQNNFANYFKHLEEFIKYFQVIRSKNAITLAADERRLHRDLFPESMSGNLKVSATINQCLISQILNLGDLVLGNKLSSSDEVKLFSFKLAEQISNLDVVFNWRLTSSYDSGKTFFFKERQVNFATEEIQTIYLLHVHRLEMYLDVVSFDFDSVFRDRMSDVLIVLRDLMYCFPETENGGGTYFNVRAPGEDLTKEQSELLAKKLKLLRSIAFTTQNPTSTPD